MTCSGWTVERPLTSRKATAIPGMAVGDGCPRSSFFSIGQTYLRSPSGEIQAIVSSSGDIILLGGEINHAAQSRLWRHSCRLDC